MDLFDYAASKAGKLDGMARVDAGAGAEWKTAMFLFTVEVAQTRRYFTSDDVFDLAYRQNGFAGTTRDYRAYGPVMLRVAKAGYCRKASLPPRNSSRRTLHNSPRAVWESLVYGGAP